MTIESLLENIGTLSVNDQRRLLELLAYKLEISIDPLEFTNRKEALLIEEIRQIDTLQWEVQGMVLTTIKIDDILYFDKNAYPDVQFKILEMEIYGHLMPELDRGDHVPRIRMASSVDITANVLETTKLYKDRE